MKKSKQLNIIDLFTHSAQRNVFVSVWCYKSNYDCQEKNEILTTDILHRWKWNLPLLFFLLENFMRGYCNINLFFKEYIYWRMLAVIGRLILCRLLNTVVRVSWSQECSDFSSVEVLLLSLPSSQFLFPLLPAQSPVLPTPQNQRPSGISSPAWQVPRQRWSQLASVSRKNVSWPWHIVCVNSINSLHLFTHKENGVSAFYS